MQKSTVISSLDIREVGAVKEVKQGIVKVSGLPSCIFGQLVDFGHGQKGMVMGFNQYEVLVIVLGDDSSINTGDTVTSRSELLTVPVGPGFVGRVVDCLARPIDARGDIKAADNYPVFREALGVMEREPVTAPLETGTKILDMVIPIGKGQRELVIGDRQTGKTSIALDAILNQKGKNVICIYCYIGGSQSALKKTMSLLNEKAASPYTIVLCATASSTPAEQYLAPYVAACLGEYFMFNGQDVLLIFDDLTKHAWAYRQLSLLLERPPGREAYPGDIFYIHSQLMERAGKLKAGLGGGTMTFLPIASTLQGDITGYIQSNLVSMTDGQIYLSSALFYEGFKPAIDLGLSVSRIGSKVQSPAIRNVSGGLRLQYAQYRELQRLTRLRTKLSKEAMDQIRRGETLRELLIQENGKPVSMAEEIVIFYAFKKRILEILKPDVLKNFKREFFKYLCNVEPMLVDKIEKEQTLTDDITTSLDRNIVNYFQDTNHLTKAHGSS
ncbi:MAG: F0F1 ATP synthase subunit alpha [Candidatus Omnitrophota bacterium]|nr:F0F1 ATP synthase subunit alpha [Candidatus Omnitrophota bacterium]